MSVKTETPLVEAASVNEDNGIQPPVPATNGPSKYIVLIHGLWMTPLSWEEWVARYTKAGYTVLTPGWPGIDERTPEDVREDPEKLKGLTIHDVVDNYEKIIKALPSKPIIMGHSFGGLFTQILLSRGLGAAGVGISPAQPAGVLALRPSTVKASFGVLGNPFTYNAAVPFTESQFHYAFGNHLSVAESKVLWQKYSVPSAAHILWSGVLGLLNTSGEGSVDFKKKDRAPLLLIAGTDDHVVPKAVVDSEYKHYKTGTSKVEMKTFEGRTHGIVNQAGWEEVADFALHWAEENAAK